MVWKSSSLTLPLTTNESILRSWSPNISANSPPRVVVTSFHVNSWFSSGALLDRNWQLWGSLPSSVRDNGASPFTDTLFPFWTETVPTVPSAAFADRANKTKSKVLKPLMMQHFYIVINSICKLTIFSPKHQIFLALFWPMRSITPPEHEFHRYLSTYQLITQIFTQIFFFGECAKKASSLFEV